MGKPQSYHIIGKVYDVNAHNIKKLAEELDAKNEYINQLTAAINKVIDMNVQESYDRYGDKTKAEDWACVRVLREGLR